MTPGDFSRLYLPYAIADLSGVPYLLTMAQAALETGWGAAVKGNNFFGIKAGPSWKGKTQLLNTTEYHDNPNVKYPIMLQTPLQLKPGRWKYFVKDYFRLYSSPLESFEDHSELLLKRWKDCIDPDPVITISKIQSSDHPYATDPSYVRMITQIISMIKKYDLSIEPRPLEKIV